MATNVPEAPAGANFFAWDANLGGLLARVAPDMVADHGERLADFGAWAGGELDAQAAYTDRWAPPKLDSHGPDGTAAGTVIQNPRYVAAHQEAYRRGAIGLAFNGDAPHLLSFTMGYLLSQADISVHCPVTMTGAVAYVLDRLAPDAVKARWLGELTRMDGAAQSAGTWATEHHGGSDVGATTTVARADRDGWRLDGLKWFTSNAGSGMALATARPEGAADGGAGLGCYLVPDTTRDAARNAWRVRRLKDKLGTRGLPTGEIELNGAWAEEVAAPPDGLKTMMEALAYSRIHNAVAGCAVQRRAFLEALCWASHRDAFGHGIIAYPMVKDTLLDMLCEGEADLALGFEAARTFDLALADPDQVPWLRVVTALAKWRTAETGVWAAKQALELVGGNGYTEEWGTARLYRDAMVLPVWEGPANVQALELLRAATGKLPGDEALGERVGEIMAALPKDLRNEGAMLRRALGDCRSAFKRVRDNPAEGPVIARRLLELAATAVAGALLLEEAGLGLADGDARKALLARRFMARHFAPRGDVVQPPDPAHAAFDAIIAVQPVAA